MTRAEHLDWCKQRALDYLKDGDAPNAIASMLSDLSKHAETRASAANPTLLMLGLMYAENRDLAGARRFIEGFR